MKCLRVLVADDHEVVRAGVRAILENEPDCEVCGEATTGNEAVALAQRLTPDVVVLDINMPELNGLEAARQILRSVAGTQVLILSVHESEELVREILNIGVHGYILKSDVGQELAGAMHALRQGELYFTPAATQIAVRACTRGEHAEDTVSASGAELTTRERQVLRLLAEGKSNKEIAGLLEISVLTVDTHRANIMSKLKLHSIVELVHYAIRNKLITP